MVEVLNEEQIKEWAIPVRDGFGNEDDNFAILLSKKPFGPSSGLRHYVAFHRNHPVNACTLSLSRYGSRIDNMATLTSLRGKGFGLAILTQALLDAKNAGIVHCLLDSSQEGLKLYQKAEFTSQSQQQISAGPSN